MPFTPATKFATVPAALRTCVLQLEKCNLIAMPKIAALSLEPVVQTEAFPDVFISLSSGIWETNL